MGVVVMVGVKRQFAGRARPEQFEERRIAHDGLRMALAANMAVEADDPVRLCHDDVQIVADQQNSAAQLVANFRDQMIKSGLPGDVDTG